MPLTTTFFSPRFGMTTDRFGVSWMVYVMPQDAAKGGRAKRSPSELEAKAVGSRGDPGAPQRRGLEEGDPG